MSTLSQTVLDQIEIDGKTIGVLPLEERNPAKVREELARMNARPVTREEAEQYQNERSRPIGSTADTRKFQKANLEEPIVFGLREDYYILGYLSDVGEDIRQYEYQGVIVVTEE